MTCVRNWAQHLSPCCAQFVTHQRAVQCTQYTSRPHLKAAYFPAHTPRQDSGVICACKLHPPVFHTHKEWDRVGLLSAGFVCSISVAPPAAYQSWSRKKDISYSSIGPTETAPLKPWKNDFCSWHTGFARSVTRRQQSVQSCFVSLSNFSKISKIFAALQTHHVFPTARKCHTSKFRGGANFQFGLSATLIKVSICICIERKTTGFCKTRRWKKSVYYVLRFHACVSFPGVLHGFVQLLCFRTVEKLCSNCQCIHALTSHWITFLGVVPLFYEPDAMKISITSSRPVRQARDFLNRHPSTADFRPTLVNKAPLCCRELNVQPTQGCHQRYFEIYIFFSLGLSYESHHPSHPYLSIIITKPDDSNQILQNSTRSFHYPWIFERHAVPEHLHEECQRSFSRTNLMLGFLVVCAQIVQSRQWCAQHIVVFRMESGLQQRTHRLKSIPIKKYGKDRISCYE